MLLFQFAGVAEQWLSNDGWANFREWSPPSRRSTRSSPTSSATGPLTPALNWYRANVPPERVVAPPLELPPVQAPTMGVWSQRRLRADSRSR